MLNLQCTKCNYRFSKEQMPKRCPYCGADGTLKKTQSAQDLLDSTIAEQAMIDHEREARHQK